MIGQRLFPQAVALSHRYRFEPAVRTVDGDARQISVLGFDRDMQVVHVVPVPRIGIERENGGYGGAGTRSKFVHLVAAVQFAGEVKAVRVLDVGCMGRNEDATMHPDDPPRRAGAPTIRSGARDNRQDK